MINSELPNVEWFNDKKTSIYFNRVPSVRMRYFVPGLMSKKEREAIKKYPFINESELRVTLFDKQKQKKYSFTIVANYCYDGASIPRMFWRLIGPPTSPEFLVPALIHDVLCENHSYIENDREFSSRVFDCLLKANEVNTFKRFLMKKSVNTFQRFCHWEEE